ncbi:MAG: hypothetical protein AB9880_06890 [Christensenellales bacterium]
MKKTLSLLLAALLLLSLTAAMAQDYSLDSKLRLQLLNGSGLTGTAALSLVPGKTMSALDAATNTLLAALLQGTTLDLRYIRGISANVGQEDLSLVLKRGTEQLADLRYTTDGVLESLGSSLLGPGKLASAKGDKLILGLLTGQAAQRWPSLERAIYTLSIGDNAWNKRAEAALKPYTDRLSLWLQAYTRITGGQGATGQPLTLNTITIPAADLKSEIKQLLTAVYQDKAVLTLLKGQLTPREVAAYLQPSMLPGLSQSIDLLPLSDNIAIMRGYDLKGAVALDEMRLPLAGTGGAQSLYYRYDMIGANESSSLIELQMAPKVPGNKTGAQCSLSFKGGPLEDAPEGTEQSSYAGTFTLTPEAAGTEGFTVDKAAPAAALVTDFTLYLDFGGEIKDQTTGASTRDYEITLLLKPVGNEKVGEQAILLKGQLASGPQTNAATRFSGSLIWQDQLTGGSITAEITGTSAAPWAIPTIAGTGALRLDSLTQEQLALQKTQLQATLQRSLLALTQSFLVP